MELSPSRMEHTQLPGENIRKKNEKGVKEGFTQAAALIG